MEWGDLIAEAKENGYSNTILPTDDYEMVVKKAEFKQQSGKKDRLQIKWEVETGPYAKDGGMEFISIDLSNPKLMSVVLSKLRGAGLSDEFFASLKDKYGPLAQAHVDHFKAIAAALHGRRAVVAVKATEYQGKPKNEFWAQRPLTETAGQPIAPDNAANRYGSVNPQQPI